MIRFASLRQTARNCLWISVVSIVLACLFNTRITRGDTPETIVACAVLGAGMLAVPYTVIRFRSDFRPVLNAYRTGELARMKQQ